MNNSNTSVSDSGKKSKLNSHDLNSTGKYFISTIKTRITHM
jgi:hypothetical protein